ncbi:MAG: hypothetical protein ACFCUR_20285 [Rhodomicrobiaceae bacterium]
MSDNKQDVPETIENGVGEHVGGEPAISDNNASDHRAQRLSDRLATMGSAGAVRVPESRENAALPERVAQRPGYGRAAPIRHSSAGRMVIGSQVPTPGGLAGDGNAQLPQPLFSSAREGGSRRVSSSAAVFFVCALAAGGTASLAYLLDDPRFAGDANSASEESTRQTFEAAVANAASARAQPVASVVTVRDPDGSGRTRLAQAGPVELSVEDVVAQTGADAIPLEIAVGRDDSGEYAFLMFRGMPEGFSLSAGFKLEDAWAVSLRDLSDLTLVTADGYQGEFDIEVLLVKGRNTPVENTVMTVRIEPARAPEPASRIASASPVEPVPVPHILTAAPSTRQEELRREIAPDRTAPPAAKVEDGLQPGAPKSGAQSSPPRPAVPEVTITREQETPMLERAFNLLGEGDIASARLLLEHLARKGSGKGAFALGQTYDPTFFRSMFSIGGPKPDPQKARKWYDIAAQLGQKEARKRLDLLAAQ